MFPKFNLKLEVKFKGVIRLSGIYSHPCNPVKVSTVHSSKLSNIVLDYWQRMDERMADNVHSP